MPTFAEARRRIAILKSVRSNGLNKTKAGFGVSNAQIQNYKENLPDLIRIFKAGQQLDEKRNAKRKGHAGRANERKAKRAKRVGELPKQCKRYPQYVYLDERVKEWFEKARKAKFIVTPRMVQKFAETTCQLDRGEKIINIRGW